MNIGYIWHTCSMIFLNSIHKNYFRLLHTFFTKCSSFLNLNIFMISNHNRNHGHKFFTLLKKRNNPSIKKFRSDTLPTKRTVVDRRVNCHAERICVVARGDLTLHFITPQDNFGHFGGSRWSYLRICWTVLIVTGRVGKFVSEFYDRNDVKISIRCFVPEIIEYNYTVASLLKKSS